MNVDKIFCLYSLAIESEDYELAKGYIPLLMKNLFFPLSFEAIEEDKKSSYQSTWTGREESTTDSYRASVDNKNFILWLLNDEWSKYRNSSGASRIASKAKIIKLQRELDNAKKDLLDASRDAFNNS